MQKYKRWADHHLARENRTAPPAAPKGLPQPLPERNPLRQQATLCLHHKKENRAPQQGTPLPPPRAAQPARSSASSPSKMLGVGVPLPPSSMVPSPARPVSCPPLPSLHQDLACGDNLGRLVPVLNGLCGERGGSGTSDKVPACLSLAGAAGGEWAGDWTGWRVAACSCMLHVQTFRAQSGHLVCARFPGHCPPGVRMRLGRGVH